MQKKIRDLKCTQQLHTTTQPESLKLHFAYCATLLLVPKDKQTLLFPPDHVSQG